MLTQNTLISHPDTSFAVMKHGLLHCFPATLQSATTSLLNGHENNAHAPVFTQQRPQFSGRLRIQTTASAPLFRLRVFSLFDCMVPCLVSGSLKSLG